MMGLSMPKSFRPSFDMADNFLPLRCILLTRFMTSGSIFRQISIVTMSFVEKDKRLPSLGISKSCSGELGAVAGNETKISLKDTYLKSEI